MTFAAPNYRGPFRLCVARPFVSKPGFIRSEWLPGVVDSAEITAEAHALLSDPRDSILTVDVWSEREQKFVHTYRKRDL